MDDFASNVLHIQSLKFLKFLEALGLDSSRASVLLNLGVFKDLCVCVCVPRSLPRCLGVFQDLSQDVLVSWSVNALGRLLLIGVWGWMSNTWQNLIGDMCHSLIGGALRLFLQDTWHLLIGRNVLIFKVTHVNTQLDYLCHRLHA